MKNPSIDKADISSMYSSSGRATKMAETLEIRASNPTQSSSESIFIRLENFLSIEPNDGVI